MRHIYTSIDIGTDTVKAVVCELYHNKLNLLAASSIKSKGVKRGLIVDVDDAKNSVSKVIKDIEEMLGIKIKKVVTSIPSYYAEYTLIKGISEITSEDKVITNKDISNTYKDIMKSLDDSTKEMISIIPIDFKVGNELVKDPKGLVGDTLITRAIMITTPKKNVYSVVSLLEGMGLEVVDITIGSVSDMCVYKNTKTEKGVGAIINIGSEITTISVYNHGIPVKSSIIGLGGKNIDNDISYMYKISMEDAIKLKEKFALAHKRYASTSDTFEVKSGDDVLKINQFKISEITMSRVEEILNLAKKEINILTNKEIEYIIVTGGTSNMAHLEYMVTEVFGKIAVIGSIGLIGLRNNKYATALGNIVYFVNKSSLFGKEYTLVDDNDIDDISSTKKNLINMSNETMLGKVFGYFFGE